MTIRKEKEQSLQQKQRDSEYETILKLRKERKERETLLKAREEGVRKHKADIDSYETEQSIKLEKERIGLLAFVEQQKERERMLDAFENALIRKQKHLSERYISVKTEQVDYMLLLEERDRKEQALREREEVLRKKQIELEKYEQIILQQEEQESNKRNSDPYDKLIAKREREFEQRMLTLKQKEENLTKREQSLKEREISLLLSNSTISTKAGNSAEQTEDALKKEKQEINVLKELNVTVKKDDSTLITEKKPQVPESLVTVTENLTLFPKVSIFSGEDPTPKNEVSFEEWKFEVNCIRKNKSYSDQVVAQAIMKSLRAPAKKALYNMGDSATLEDIMKTLDVQFGSVTTGISAMQEFFTASQKQDESAASWGLRLETIIQKAIDKGYMKKEEKNDLLKEQFWRQLRSERLKNATRVHYNTISSFELLRREVRQEENEMKKSPGVQFQPLKAGGQQEETKEEGSDKEAILARLSAIEKMLKYRRWPFNRRNQGYQGNRNQAGQNNKTEGKDENKEETETKTLNE